MPKEHISEEKILKRPKPEAKAPHKDRPGATNPPLSSLQQTVGNRAVQRLIAQRSGDGPFELDDDTASRINQQRGGGQALDSTIQTQMGEAVGQDFSGVKVHTDPESHSLNEQLGAKAFTTGQDIFFREGAYNPGSSGGQELLAHELTHVVQQSAGRAGGGTRMTVNAPGDAFEMEADSVAKTISNPGAGANVQLQAAPEEEEEVQAKPEDVQLQEVPEEEEEVQLQELEEEEEVQMQEIPEEEEQL